MINKVLRRLKALRALLGARRSTRARLDGAPMRRILVVCYGNIYRSAFLGEYLRRHLDGLAQVRSAGFHPVAGRPSPVRHVELSADLGVALDQHRSAIMTPDDLQWADTIILMDRHNWDALQSAGGDERKYVWIGSLCAGKREIVDPYTLTDGSARQVIGRLKQCGEAFIAAVRASVARTGSSGSM